MVVSLGRKRVESRKVHRPTKFSQSDTVRNCKTIKLAASYLDAFLLKTKIQAVKQTPMAKPRAISLLLPDALV